MKAAVSPHSPMSRRTAWVRGLMLTALVAGAWVVSTSPAHARDDVYWSIGVHSPGVAVGVSNAPPPPVVVHPAYPVYSGYPTHVPRPVYRQHPIVVQHPPVVVHQPYPYGYARPIVVAPAPYFHPGRGHGSRWDDRGHPSWRHQGEHRHHNRHSDRYERHERDGGWDDRRR